ncbi:MAG: hypothetical protein AAFV95_15005 [Bacteroidota bacterium]
MKQSISHPSFGKEQLKTDQLSSIKGGQSVIGGAVLSSAAAVRDSR